MDVDLIQFCLGFIIGMLIGIWWDILSIEKRIKRIEKRMKIDEA